MPTGYTDCVRSGEVTEFADFAMKCARAFGACIEMRDEPSGTPIPEAFEPEAMLANVNEWEPPTSEHARLKEFMREQLESSIKWDCGDGTIAYPKPVDKTPAEWRAERLASLASDIAYHEREWRKEVERTESRNEWIKSLRDSLNLTPA
jgi:hypothetical protein